VGPRTGRPEDRWTVGPETGKNQPPRTALAGSALVAELRRWKRQCQLRLLALDMAIADQREALRHIEELLIDEAARAAREAEA
jgi:hypothetical protein